MKTKLLLLTFLSAFSLHAQTASQILNANSGSTGANPEKIVYIVSGNNTFRTTDRANLVLPISQINGISGTGQRLATFNADGTWTTLPLNNFNYTDPNSTITFDNVSKTATVNQNTVMMASRATDSITAINGRMALKSRTLTINGVGYNLSANRSWTIPVFSGAYSDLTGKPSLFEGDYNSLTNRPILFSGAYSDLTGKPTLFSGAYADLSGKPTLFDGVYSSLSGKPDLSVYYLASNPSNYTTTSATDLLYRPIGYVPTFASITSKPTTLSGYGITDAYPLSSNPSGYLTSVAAQSFASLTGKPTTLSGYGIADAYPLTGNPSNFLTSVPAQSFASLTSKPTTLAGYGIVDAYPLSGNPSAFLTSVPAQSFASLTGKPTTLSGYGITDAATSTQGAKADTALQSEVDGSVTNEIQNLSYNSGTGALGISSGTGVTLPLINNSNVISALGGTPLFVEVDGSVTNEIEVATQTGQSGKYLTTNGTVTSWANPTATPSGTAGGQLSGTYPNPNVIAITGVTTVSNATAGNVGEFVESKVATGSAVSLTNGATGNITSIGLSAGDWDIEASVVYNSGAATVTGKTTGISLTSATLPTDGSEVASGLLQTLITGKDGATIPRKRVNVSATTTVYLVANCAFSLGTVGAYGVINARRVR